MAEKSVNRPSPFPGMDPYLESHWEDVHHGLITYARDLIQPQLAEDLIARSEERVYVDLGDSRAAHRKPDIRVVDAPLQFADPGASASAGVIDRPVLLEFDFDPVVETYIKILDPEGKQIVTAIEFVSPGNKVPGEGRRAYLKKREEFLASDANLVEIDLVRKGEWVTMLSPYHVPVSHQTTYRVSIRRSIPGTRGEFYPITLRSKLPTIGIPLRAGEPDVALNLHTAVEMVYTNGRYWRTDYETPCDPPLTGADAEWADQLLRTAGRRG